MKRIGLYPGSFNPFHKGHLDILKQAVPLFDQIYVSCPIQSYNNTNFQLLDEFINKYPTKNIQFTTFNSLLFQYASQISATTIIRGLRNGVDFEYEKSMLYWNQDLGLTIPTIYFISDRELVHISSSAIREVSGLK